VDDSLTIGIGTALYRAPEQEMVHSGSHNAAFSVPYNQKADMYSLGIILFEMCHPKFDTQMERFTTLKRLRESQLFPDLFNDSNFPSKELVKIIKWLTNQDPKDRPSATELLSSDLFPSKFDAIDSKYIEELNEAINRPNSLVSLKVLLTLFNKMKFLKEYESSSQFLKEILFNNLSFYIRSFQKDQKLMSYRLLKENVSTFVNKRAQGNAAASLSSTRDHGQSLIVNSLLYLNCLKKHLREIFEIHGGVEYSNQYLELKTSASEYVYYNPYLKKASSSSGYPICEYLDKNGQTLLLPNNLVTPFARIAAFLNLTVAQRFAFEKIYYSSSSTNEKSVATLLNFGNNIQSSQPEVLNEAIYDVIVPANSSIHAIMAEYEILSCTRAFLKRYRQLIPSYFVRLGHSLLTDALMGIICLDIHVNKLRGGNTPGNPNSATPNNQQQTKHEHNASNLAGEREKTGTTTNLDDISVKIRKVLSLCNEIQNEKELHDLVFDQKLPAYQASKVTTFCRSYIRQARVSRENPLFLLSCIEKVVFFSCFHQY
jgi:serine/threonine protein kinase